MIKVHDWCSQKGCAQQDLHRKVWSQKEDLKFTDRSQLWSSASFCEVQKQADPSCWTPQRDPVQGCQRPTTLPVQVPAVVVVPVQVDKTKWAVVVVPVQVDKTKPAVQGVSNNSIHFQELYWKSYFILDGLEFLRLTLNNWRTSNFMAILFWPLEGLRVCLFLLNCVAPPY